jgi:hypothetical protein
MKKILTLVILLLMTSVLIACGEPTWHHGRYYRYVNNQRDVNNWLELRAPDSWATSNTQGWFTFDGNNLRLINVNTVVRSGTINRRENRIVFDNGNEYRRSVSFGQPARNRVHTLETYHRAVTNLISAIQTNSFNNLDTHFNLNMTTSRSIIEWQEQSQASFNLEVAGHRRKSRTQEFDIEYFIYADSSLVFLNFDDNNYQFVSSDNSLWMLRDIENFLNPRNYQVTVQGGQRIYRLRDEIIDNASNIYEFEFEIISNRSGLNFSLNIKSRINTGWDEFVTMIIGYNIQMAFEPQRVQTPAGLPADIANQFTGRFVQQWNNAMWVEFMPNARWRTSNSRTGTFQRFENTIILINDNGTRHSTISVQNEDSIRGHITGWHQDHYIRQ